MTATDKRSCYAYAVAQCRATPELPFWRQIDSCIAGDAGVFIDPEILILGSVI